MPPQTLSIRERDATPSPALAHFPPAIQRILAARGIEHPEQLELPLTALHGLRGRCALGGLEVAVERLLTARDGDQRLLIVGDFDADGATASALMLLGLRALGFQQVDFLVPDRFRYGYGLSAEIVAAAAPQRPDLIITVDNGVASIEGVDAAQACGIDVIVTDHHLPGMELPRAVAIVNPNLEGDPFPSKHLAGVGVAFYLLSALRAALRQRGDFEVAPNLAQFLDLVALGTVADLVPLDRNNRILVDQGLRRIRAGQARPGILALLEVAGRQANQLVSSDLGFCLGPRLNAAGRLSDMAIGIRCLISDDMTEARTLAAELDRLNRERRVIESQMQEEAVAALTAFEPEAGGEGEPLTHCLYDPEWHQGVIGLLAGRIKDRTYRPTIAFAPGTDGLLKGSARTIPGLHIRDALAAVAARHPGLLRRFGGHAMAAGLTIEVARLDEFRQMFESEVARLLSPEQLEPVAWSDGELDEAEIDLPLAQAIRDLGPWGKEFPEPSFHGRFEVINSRVIGAQHLKLVLRQLGGSRLIDAFAFRCIEAPAAQIEALYRLELDRYRNALQVRLVIEQMAA